MAQIFKEVVSCAPSQKSDVYIYNIAPTTANGLAAITSADELLLLDRQEFQSTSVLYLAGVPVGITSMVVEDQDGASVTCCGRDGVTATFDLRSQEIICRFKQDRPITALACSGNDIATGTELSNHQAVVSVWDKRKWQLRWQNTENNDDITDLHFHPADGSRLLSGGVDGLVSIFDTSIANEEDSLAQVINYRPIHKAGFLSEKIIYALSSDEHVSLHPVSSTDDSDDSESVVLGDLRERLGCEYAIDVSPKGLEGYLAVASCSTHPRIELRPLEDGQLTSEPQMTLFGAHGREIVRSLFADSESSVVFTAGEDGKIKAFRASADQPSVPMTSKAREDSNSADSRFRPY